MMGAVVFSFSFVPLCIKAILRSCSSLLSSRYSRGPYIMARGSRFACQFTHTVITTIKLMANHASGGVLDFHAIALAIELMDRIANALNIIGVFMTLSHFCGASSMRHIISAYLIRWRLVHKPLSFRLSDRQHRALAIIHLASVPQEIVLPEIPMQVFAADVVIDTHDAALY